MALTAQHGLTQLFQGILGIVAQGLDVGIGGTGADQKIVRQTGNLIDPQQLDIQTLLAVQRLGHFVGNFLCS